MRTDLSSVKLTISAKVQLIKGRYAAQLPYQARVQVPREAKIIVEETQQEMDAALWGGYNPITKKCAHQPHKDGGVGQLHLWSRLEAEWASLVTDSIKRNHTRRHG